MALGQGYFLCFLDVTQGRAACAQACGMRGQVMVSAVHKFQDPQNAWPHVSLAPRTGSRMMVAIGRCPEANENARACDWGLLWLSSGDRPTWHRGLVKRQLAQPWARSELKLLHLHNTSFPQPQAFWQEKSDKRIWDPFQCKKQSGDSILDVNIL